MTCLRHSWRECSASALRRILEAGQCGEMLFFVLLRGERPEGRVPASHLEHEVASTDAVADIQFLVGRYFRDEVTLPEYGI